MFFIPIRITYIWIENALRFQWGYTQSKNVSGIAADGLAYNADSITFHTNRKKLHAPRWGYL